MDRLEAQQQERDEQASELDRCIHQNHVYRIRSPRKDLLLPEWFECYFNSPVGRSFFEAASKQTTNLASINMTQLRGCPLPLPPSEEQCRIVAKVDQLMTLVDQLETQLAASRATATNLLEALVPRSRLEAAGVAFDQEHNMAVCCAGCNGLKGEAVPPVTHSCWKSRKACIKECARFIAGCRLKNFQKYKAHVEKVLKKRAGL